jgi:hypothetical protein
MTAKQLADRADKRSNYFLSSNYFFSNAPHISSLLTIVNVSPNKYLVTCRAGVAPLESQRWHWRGRKPRRVRISRSTGASPAVVPAAIAVAHGAVLPVLGGCLPFFWPSQKLLPK